MGYIITIDTETTTDTTQRLTFGMFRYSYTDGQQLSTLAEGIIYADDLPDTDPDGYARLQRYAATRTPDIDRGFYDREPNPHFELLSRDAFATRWLWHAGYKHRETIVGFNLPFDLTRLAVDVGEATKDYTGGFSLTMWRTRDGRTDTYKPRLRIKMLDSKKAFIRYAASNKEPYFEGRFVDLRTLTFALTNTGHSLASACRTFGVAHGKLTTEEHGKITENYIDYCRRDVLATAELYAAATTELARHNLDVSDTHVYSPASIAKKYFQKMAIPQPLRREDVPPEVISDAMSSFYGARAECRIRRVPMPVAQVDFTSMYPTVNTLMGMWSLLTSTRINTVHDPDRLQTLLGTITLDDCFEPEMWRNFTGLAKIRPDDDIVPVRARYGGSAWTIGVNYITADEEYWYAIPDLVASVLLTGRVPTVVDAVRFEPVGTAPVQRVKLRGTVPIDPQHDDFFQRVVEERAEYKDTPTGDFLKVMANSGCYGIFAELNKQGTGPDAVESPGPYTFPPIATCITAAARLMLAMLERCVVDQDGSWVFTDTDSMAIVADTTARHHAGVRALDYRTVEDIRQRFNRLNPYDPRLIPDLLKMEYQGWCYAISAKRYALYHRDTSGRAIVDKQSEHGLGHLLNPTDPDSDDTRWITQVWEYLISDALDGQASEPYWLDRPAITRYAVSQPALLRTFSKINENLEYPNQIKPANFILVGHAHQIQPWYRTRVVPITPYEPDASQWLSLEWRNKHSPEDVFKLDTLGDMTTLTTGVVYVQSYRDVLAQYAIHPETKFNQDDGQSCTPGYSGPLHRKHVRATGITRIGKESNDLDAVQHGLLTPDEVTQQQRVQHWDDMFSLVKPVIERYSINQIAQATGISRSTVGHSLTGRAPSAKNADAIVRLAATIAADDLSERYIPATDDPLAILAKYKDTIASQPQSTGSVDEEASG